MSDKEATEKSMTSLKRYPSYSYVYEDDFAAVDNSLFDFHFDIVEENPSIRFLRAQRNNGHVQYYLRGTNESLVLGLAVSKLDGQRVRLMAYVDTEQLPNYSAEKLAAEFLRYRLAERATPNSLPITAEPSGIAHILPAGKPIGRPESDANRRARQALELGSDRTEVFLQWVADNTAAGNIIDLSDPAQAKRARETFKRAMSRKGRKGTK